MNRLKLDSLSGDILFRVDDIDRVDGIYLATVSDARMTAAAFEKFFDALTSPQCALDVRHKLASYQVPFLFRLQ